MNWRVLINHTKEMEDIYRGRKPTIHRYKNGKVPIRRSVALGDTNSKIIDCFLRRIIQEIISRVV